MQLRIFGPSVLSSLSVVRPLFGNVKERRMKSEKNAKGTEKKLLNLKNQTKRAENIDSFEDLLKIIRPMGAWQIRIYICIAFIQYVNAMMSIAVTFYQIEPEAACVVPNASEAFRQLPMHQQLTMRYFGGKHFGQNFSSPSLMVKERMVYDHCRYYNRDYSNESVLQFMDTNATPLLLREWENNQSDCTKWIFNRSNNMYSTAVTQFELVCEWKFGVEFSQTVNMMGYLVGSLVAGYLSDRFGRRVTTALGGMTSGVLGCLLVLAPSYPWFVLGRFLLPFTIITAQVATFVLAMETTSSRWRVWVGGCFWLPYAFGYISVAGVAALIRDWRLLHVVISAPALLAILCLWLLPESPRWLLSHGDVIGAEKVLRDAAIINHTELPILIDFKQITANLNKESVSSSANRSLLILFRRNNGKFKYPKMILHTLNLGFNWLVNMMVYFGILLNVSSFAGDVFVNNAIGGATEIPGYLLTLPLLRWSRRNGLALALFLACFSLFVVPWIPEETANGLRVSVAMFGKLCITASFGVVYVLTGEMYPTEIRSSALAYGNSIGRIGSAIAPFISSLHKVDPKLRWLTMVIFGSFSLAAAILTLFLPETKGKNLAETLDGIWIDGAKNAIADPEETKQTTAE